MGVLMDDDDDRVENDHLYQLERIQAAADALARRVLWEQGNRIGLLAVHSAAAFVAGGQQLLYGSAVAVESEVGVWIRPFFGIVAILGAVTLSSGLRAKPRSIVREFWGLLLIGSWDLAMTLGLLWARLAQENFAPIPWGTPQPDHYVSAYPVAVYGGLFALIVIHLLTLRTFRKTGAPPAGDLKDLR